eukprot:Skav235450  [mRNA]  locus=scaffold2206:333434:339262:- [translate_table: standard]
MRASRWVRGLVRQRAKRRGGAMRWGGKEPVPGRVVGVEVPGTARGQWMGWMGRQQQIGPFLTAMVDTLDRWGVMMGDYRAMKSGCRLSLRKIRVDDGLVVGASISNSFPTMIVKCAFPSWAIDRIALGETFSIVDFSLHQNLQCYHAEGREHPLLPFKHHSNDKAKAATELFAGLGGWSVGAKLCGLPTKLYVECDPMTAEACSRTHSIPCLNVADAMQAFRENCLPESFVLCGDVMDYHVAFLISMQNAGWWLMSPPCQPWSRAGGETGINSLNGQVLFHAVFLAALIHASGVSMENVPGFPDHEHYVKFKHALQRMQWQLILSTQDRIAPLRPVIRNRWLGFLMPMSFVVNTNALRLANNMSIPNEVPGVGKESSIGSAGCFQTNIQDWEWQRCLPDQEALELLGKYDLLPKAARTQISQFATSEQIIQFRTKTCRHMFPNAMASIGSQHKLPLKHLQTKGLHTFLIQDGSSKRYPLPFELAMALGYPAEVVLPTDYRMAWQMVGNGLSASHSALQCLRVHVLLGNDSPFECDWKGPFDLCKAILKNAIQLEDYHVMCEDDWMFLTNRLPATVPDSPTEEPGDGTPKSHKACIFDPYDEPPTKMRCITPTWRTGSDSEDELVPQVNREDFRGLPQEVLRTVAPKVDSLLIKLVNPLPDDVQMHMKRDEVIHKNNAFCAAVLHDQGIWGEYIWRDDNETVRTSLKKVLPHAISDHFETILVNQDVARMSTVPLGTRDCEIIFTPKYFARVVQSSLLDETLVARVDLTWKIQDLLAYAAAEAAILPSKLLLRAGQEIMHPDEFVLAHKSTEFQMEYQRAFVPMDDLVFGPTHPSNGMSIVDPEAGASVPVHTEYVVAAHQGFLRFAIRDPKWGSVRTVTCEKKTKIDEMIAKLMPSFVQESKPCVMIGDTIIDGSHAVDMLLSFNQIEVHFPTARPWPNTPLICLLPLAPLQKEREMVEIQVKGPYETKPKGYKYYKGTSLTEVAAKFVDCFQGSFTMLTLINGKSVDSRTQVQDIADSIVHVRVCALPGGGKHNQETIQQLAKVLSKRGVPETESTNRAKLIIEKVPIADIKTILTKDEVSMWSEMKKLANQAKVRMILASELKTFQKDQRTNTKKNVNKHDAGPRRSMDPTRVTINVQHFKSPNQQVSMLDVAKFGPDASGLAIASRAQAEKLMPVTKLSLEPLALLVFTNQPIAQYQPMMIPAVDQKGQPILTNAVLINYGDQPIVCQPEVPQTTMPEIKAATIEVRVLKSLVANWSETRNPMVYLGLMLPEVRSDQVIATWSMKFYDDNRKQKPHDQASYLHGYMRIPSALLEPTLKRSGTAGLFIQSKSENHKADPSYSIVPLHGYSIDKALEMSKSIEHVLGIVLLGSTNVYALRGKREHINAIRRAALPQCLTPQEGLAQPDAMTWVIKSLKTNTTCQQLSQALKQLGWNAEALRPTGAQTWLVSSQYEPPSSHLIINGQYVAVVALGLKYPTQSAPRNPKTVHIPDVDVQADFDCFEDPEEASSTTASRLTDIRTTLQDQLTEMVTDKFRVYEEHLSKLHTTIETYKADTDANTAAVRAEVQAVQKNQGALEEHITNANKCVLDQMQTLFAQMQGSLNAINTRMDEENKRPRKDGVASEL